MRKFLLTTALALGLASPASAQDFIQVWTDQLTKEGYTEIEVERTWLGRIRIEAEVGNIEREIILDRRSGEVLRDYSQTDEGDYRYPFSYDEDDKHEDE